MDEDISRLKTTAIGLLSDLGCNGSTLTEDLINEICRFGAAELHAVAAFIGGIASQEVIKVVRLISMFVSKKEQYTYLVVLHFSYLLSRINEFPIWLSDIGFLDDSSKHNIS